jgi:hypothetical protein
MLRRGAITDVKLIVSKQDETFDEAFEESTFVPLQTFAKQKHIDAESEEQLIRVIQKRWPSLEVSVGKSGCLGVFVTELGEGEYKYKRGARTSALRKKDEYDNNGVVATESLEDMLENLSDNNTYCDRDGDDDSEQHLLARLTSASVVAIVGRLMPGHVDPLASTIAMGPRAATRSMLSDGPLASRLSTVAPSDGEDNVAPPRPIRGRRRPGHAATRESRESEAASVVESGKKRKKGRGSLCVEVVESGHQLLIDVQQQLSPEALWGRRVRSCDFENTLATMSGRPPSSHTSSTMTRRPPCPRTCSTPRRFLKGSEHCSQSCAPNPNGSSVMR